MNLYLRNLNYMNVISREYAIDHYLFINTFNIELCWLSSYILIDTFRLIIEP